MLDGARRHRETFAWALVGYVAVNVLVELFRLFGGRGFTANATVNHLEFVSPLVAGALALAVLLVASGPEPTARARTVVATALGVAGAALLLGVVAWLGGLTVNSFLQGTADKVLNSFLFLAGAGLLSGVGWFSWLVYERLPAPARSQVRWAHGGWESQPGPPRHWPAPQQPHYGQPHYDPPQYEQPQYGQPHYEQPRYGEPQHQQPQYGSPPWGAPQSAPQDETRWVEPATEAMPTEGLSIFGDPAAGPAEQTERGEATRDDAAAPGEETRVEPTDPGHGGWPPRRF